MTDLEAEAWKKGYEAGVRFSVNKNEDAIKIGDAILDVMYKRFATHQEDD